MDSINELIKNSPISISNHQINSLLEGLGEDMSLPSDPRLVTTSYNSLPYSFIYDNHICNRVIVNQSVSRIDIEWNIKRD